MFFDIVCKNNHKLERYNLYGKEMSKITAKISIIKTVLVTN